MKQYTDKQQTQELLKLGFPKPECIADYNIGMFDDIEEINAYSAIDLISFLGGHLLKIGTEEILDYFTYTFQYTKNRKKLAWKEIRDPEIINGLYRIIVELKKENIL